MSKYLATDLQIELLLMWIFYLWLPDSRWITVFISRFRHVYKCENNSDYIVL